MKFNRISYCFSTALLAIALGGFSLSAQSAVNLSAAIGGEIVKKFKTGKLRVSKIEVTKPHIFDEQELAQLLAKYEGREVTIDELRNIQSTLSKYYFETGYVNSGVVIPNQDIESGTIKLQTIHGRLTKVKIAGNSSISREYIYSKVKNGISVPLNTLSLQRALVSLRQDPLIADVKANLEPGEELGQSILQLQIKENSPYFLNAEANNHRSVSIGQYGVSLIGGHRNISGRQDTLRANVGVTEGLREFGLNYSLPIGINGINANAFYNYTNFAVVDPILSPANIEGDTSGFGVNVFYPFYRESQFNVGAKAGLSLNSMSYSLLGGSENINSSSPISMGIEGVYQVSRFASAMSVGVRQGLALGLENTEENLYSESFSVGVAQVYAAYQPKNRVEIVGRVNGQVAGHALPPVEKFAMGGARSVRGYKENLFVRDSGFVASAHVRFPVYKSTLFMLPFLDYGRTWEKSDGLVATHAEELLSAGAGLQWNISKVFRSEFYVGFPLLDVDQVDDQQQDGGFHFTLNYKIY